MGPRAGLDKCRKSRPLPGFDPWTTQTVASRYTDYATRPTYLLCTLHVKHVKSQRLASDVSTSWSFRLIYRTCIQWVVLTWLQKQEDSELKQRLIVCVLSVTEWLVSDVATPISIRTYKFRAANKILPPSRTFVSRNPLTPLCGTQFQKQRSNRTGLKPLSEPPVLQVNPLNPELNPICYLLTLLGGHHFLHVSRIRVKSLTFRRLMSYIYIYIYIYMEHPFLILDHTQRRSTVGRTPLDE